MKEPDWSNPRLTIGDRYNPAMQIDNVTEALDYLEKLIDWDMRHHDYTAQEAARLERSNLGYYAGYFSFETRQRVERLFGATRPVFGASNPTPEEAYQAGLKWVEKHS